MQIMRAIVFLSAAFPFFALAETPQSLREAVNGRFDIGVGIGLKAFQDAENRALVTQHFNYVTPENCLKFASTQPAEGDFRFE